MRTRFIQDDGVELGLDAGAVLAYEYYPAFEDKDGDVVKPKLVVYGHGQVLTFRGVSADYLVDQIRHVWAECDKQSVLQRIFLADL